MDISLNKVTQTALEFSVDKTVLLQPGQVVRFSGASEVYGAITGLFEEDSDPARQRVQVDVIRGTPYMSMGSALVLTEAAVRQTVAQIQGTPQQPLRFEDGWTGDLKQLGLQVRLDGEALSQRVMALESLLTAIKPYRKALVIDPVGLLSLMETTHLGQEVDPRSWHEVFAGTDISLSLQAVGLDRFLTGMVEGLPLPIQEEASRLLSDRIPATADFIPFRHFLKNDLMADVPAKPALMHRLYEAYEQRIFADDPNQTLEHKPLVNGNPVTFLNLTRLSDLWQRWFYQEVCRWHLKAGDKNLMLIWVYPENYLGELYPWLQKMEELQRPVGLLLSSHTSPSLAGCRFDTTLSGRLDHGNPRLCIQGSLSSGFPIVIGEPIPAVLPEDFSQADLGSATEPESSVDLPAVALSDLNLPNLELTEKPDETSLLASLPMPELPSGIPSVFPEEVLHDLLAEAPPVADDTPELMPLDEEDIPPATPEMTWLNESLDDLFPSVGLDTDTGEILDLSETALLPETTLPPSLQQEAISPLPPLGPVEPLDPGPFPDLELLGETGPLSSELAPTPESPAASDLESLISSISGGASPEEALSDLGLEPPSTGPSSADIDLPWLTEAEGNPSNPDLTLPPESESVPMGETDLSDLLGPIISEASASTESPESSTPETTPDTTLGEDLFNELVSEVPQSPSYDLLGGNLPDGGEDISMVAPDWSDDSTAISHLEPTTEPEEDPLAALLQETQQALGAPPADALAPAGSESEIDLDLGGDGLIFPDDAPPPDPTINLDEDEAFTLELNPHTLEDFDLPAFSPEPAAATPPVSDITPEPAGAMDLSSLISAVEETTGPATTSQATPAVSEPILTTVSTSPASSQTASAPAPIPIHAAARPTMGPSPEFKEGQRVRHHQYGDGVIRKVVPMPNRVVINVEFDKMGKRLLDPKLANLERV